MYLTKRLFVSLVRPSLEYGCVLWSPFYSCHSDRIESVQVQFLLFALRSLPWNTSENLPPYENRLKLIDLPTLKQRRYMLRALFIIKLIRGQIDSAYLTTEIMFNVPRRNLRNFAPLQLSFARSNYELNNPMRSLFIIYNELSNSISISDTLDTIKSFILRS